jgi:hypothetical protein
MHEISVVETEGKRQLARPRHRREDRIKMGLKKCSWSRVQMARNSAQCRNFLFRERPGISTS